MHIAPINRANGEPGEEEGGGRDAAATSNGDAAVSNGKTLTAT